MNRTSLLDLARGDLNADLVSIDVQRIRAIEWPAKQEGGMLIELPWHDPERASEGFEFLVAMGSLNFRFWSTNADGSLDRYKRGNKTGARALWAAFEENWHGGYRSFNERLRSDKTCAAVFGDIPYLDQRLEILKSLFEHEEFESFCNKLHQHTITSGKVTTEMAGALAESFPIGFADPYLKKAQLVLSMHAGFLRTFDCIIDTSDLLAFADYQVPRVLRALKVIQFSPAVQEMVDDGRLIAEGSPIERSIRSATIFACEEIANATGSSAADVDNWLWQAQNVAGDSRFHLTPTTKY